MTPNPKTKAREYAKPYYGEEEAAYLAGYEQGQKDLIEATEKIAYKEDDVGSLIVPLEELKRLAPTSSEGK